MDLKKKLETVLLCAAEPHRFGDNPGLYSVPWAKLKHSKKMCKIVRSTVSLMLTPRDILNSYREFNYTWVNFFRVYRLHAVVPVLFFTSSGK
jgi:hypothetical protein